MRHLTLTAFAALLLAVVLMSCSNDGLPTEPQYSGQTGLLAQSFVPADATVDSAYFWIHVTEAPGRNIGLHRVTSEWSESSVTWTDFGGAVVADPEATVLVNDTGWFRFDMTAIAEGWFDSTFENYGVAFNDADTGAAFTGFDSREASANAPYLQVCYTTHEGASCETFESLGDATIDEASPDSNFADETTLYTGRDTTASSNRMALVQTEFPVEIRYVTIGDRAWEDMNLNGLQDDGEPGFAGVVVHLFTCDDEMVAADTTDASGNYMFDSVMAGDYYLHVVTPDNYVITMMDAGADDAIDSDADPETGKTNCMTFLPGVTDMSIDFGFYEAPATVGDFIWNDMNMNGIQDDGEPGLEGIEVTLYSCDDVMVASTTSDADGMYMFEDLRPGDYYLEFANPFGWIFTYQDQGDDDAVDSDVDRYRKTTMCFTLGAGDEAYGWDAGLFEFDGCTYGKGYWKNHAGFGPQADSVSHLLLPIWLGNEGGDKSLEVGEARMAVDLLQQHTYGEPSNGITKLYAHLLTAKLNIVNFANPADIYETIGDADDFLADHDWNDWDSLSKDDRKMVLSWKDMLEAYNEGYTGPGSCDDGDDDYSMTDYFDR